MRSFAILLLTGLVAGACDEDPVSLPNPCQTSIDQTLAAYGTPDEVREEEDGGDFFMTLVYDAEGTEEGLAVLFRWGANIEGCAVEPPNLLS